MTVSLRRALRKTARAVRKSAPAVVTVCILAALIGGTLAGVLVR